jgi:hypothetical protein
VFLIFYVIFRSSIVHYIKDENIDTFVNYDNKFKYKPSNTRILYRNVGELPWNRHTINSSIPYDIRVQQGAEKAYYYEFDNKKYNENLKEVFKSNCEELIIAVEGTNWSNWKNPKAVKDQREIDRLLRYYNVLFNVIDKKLNESHEMNLPGNQTNKKIQIVHDLVNRYRVNLDNDPFYMFDMDLILYREGKLQGKHVKIVAITNGFQTNIILTRIVGVVNEDNIVLHPYVGNDSMDKFDFEVFIPEGNVSKERENRMTEWDTADRMKDENVYSEIENIIYKKLLENHNTEDDDISNNNYKPKKGELVKRDKMNACST